ncbi:VOC family protein [Saccharopolyspora mangrovi]|uniref:VOC family protein n=1 Tax=Saccharopolyspora mangrovi TaxID=3082379 RepID=A0ABU6A4K1_9PSEU|nr:VOC family protein [Saccharopolyspora sp. S2-29]MEB3366507.1 VOC family protein [Saccharopolyspora sp. S2-29]
MNELTPPALHHVSLVVRNLDEALDFYVGALGLRQRTDRPDTEVRGAWLDLRDHQLHLIEGQPPPALGQHFALHVAELDPLRERLVGLGVEVSEPVPVGRARQSFLQDPSGNHVELHESAR